MRTSLTIALVAALGACAPSHSAIWGPVSRDLTARTGAHADWRDPSAAAADISALLKAPITADSAAAIALARSDELQASFDELDLAAAGVGDATAPPDPSITAAIRYPRGDGSTEFALGALEDVRGLLLTPLARHAAEASLEAARRQAVRAAIDLAARARSDWFRATAAARLATLARTVAETTDAGADLADALRAAGNVSELARAREQAFHEDAQLDLAAALAAALAARARLDATLGLSGDEATTALADTLLDPPGAAPALDDVEARVIDRSLVLDELRWTIRAAAREVGVARWRTLVPRLELGVAAQRAADGWSVGPEAALSIPLGSMSSGSRTRAWAALRRAQHLYAARAVEVRAAARSARDQLLLARERALHLRDVVLPLRRRVLDEAVKAYNAMTQTPFDLLVARREQLAAQRAYVIALRDYWLAQTALDQLLAGGSPDAALELVPGGTP